MSRILGTIPEFLENKLTDEFLEIKRLFQMNEFQPSQLNAGRLAEVVLRIFQDLLSETITPLGNQISARDKTRILNSVENHPTLDPHIRQKSTSIVRLLLDFRNNRDIAHLGGLNANKIDAYFIMISSNWIYAEFIRVYGNYPIEDAQIMIDKLGVPNYPVIFDIDGDEFIARDNLKSWEEVLVFCSVRERGFDFLYSKTKDSNKKRFSDTISRMIKDRLILIKDGKYYIMPKGIEKVKERKLLEY
ncbi:hypothetical protein CL684_02365 [Candidatus Campbellbacteria bacterium]|nr:hypothetical protein [Candidatus Campbellbacteria bacterium]